MKQVYRRRGDESMRRILLSMVVFSIALGVLSSYLGYKAITAMDSVDKLGKALFKLGFVTGANKTFPHGLENE